MDVEIVREWLAVVADDLDGAWSAAHGPRASPTRAAYLVQQAAEKLVKAALVAFAIRPIWTHDIGDLATQLPADTPCRDRFVALGRLTVFAHAFRYPGEDKPPRKPTAQEVEGWVAEIEALKADFERWLETRQDGGDR